MAVGTEVELRCPHGPKSLLAKLLSPMDSLEEHLPVFEVHCRSCVKEMRKDDPSVARVLHRFDVSGRLVHSIIERRQG